MTLFGPQKKPENLENPTTRVRETMTHGDATNPPATRRIRQGHPGGMADLDVTPQSVGAASSGKKLPADASGDAPTRNWILGGLLVLVGLALFAAPLFLEPITVFGFQSVAAGVAWLMGAGVLLWSGRFFEKAHGAARAQEILRPETSSS